MAERIAVELEISAIKREMEELSVTLTDETEVKRLEELKARVTRIELHIAETPIK